MGFLDLLFGEKIIKTDDFFGRIESDKTRKKDLTKTLSWNFYKKIKPFSKETFFILEGDYNNINSTQKLEVQKFIENFDSLHSLEIDKLLLFNTEFAKFKNWRSEYYISFIGSLHNSNTDFEINLEGLDESNELYFFVELRNGVVKNITV